MCCMVVGGREETEYNGDEMLRRPRNRIHAARTRTPRSSQHRSAPSSATGAVARVPWLLHQLRVYRRHLARPVELTQLMKRGDAIACHQLPAQVDSLPATR